MSRIVFSIVITVLFIRQSPKDVYFLQKDKSKEESVVVNPNLLFTEDFEGILLFHGFHHQFATTYAFNVVLSPVYSGLMAGRFELRATDPMVSRGTRSEVLFDIPEHKERWYSFAAYFPSDAYEVDSNNDIINQWHQEGSPATSLRIRNDRFLVRTGNTKESREEIDLGGVTKDTWHKFVFHFIHSDGDDGLLEVWHNGAKVLTHKGGNMYKGRLPRWKVGIYKDDWNGDETTDSVRRVYYIDSIKIGNENASFTDM